jgi:hypothetical protein
MLVDVGHDRRGRDGGGGRDLGGVVAFVRLQP